MTIEQKLIWFAGIVDGEGSICAFYNHTGNYSSPTPCVGFSITNTNVAMLRTCQEVIEHVTNWRPKEYIDRHNKKRQCFKLSVRCHGRIRAILVAILPYLVAKNHQAITAIALCESFQSGKKLDREHRVNLAEQLKALNSGSIVTTNTPNVLYCTKIESDLAGDSESAPAVMLEA